MKNKVIKETLLKIIQSKEWITKEFAMCSNIETRMVWVVWNNEEPSLDFSTIK